MTSEKKFQEIVNYYIKLYNNAKDAMLKEEAQDTVKEFVNHLNELNPSKQSDFIEMLEKVGLSKNDLVNYKEVEENKTVDNSVNNLDNLTDEQRNAIDYVNEKIYSSNDSNMINEFNELLEQLEEDFENTNDKLIETWLNNYKDFVSTNELDENMMYYFVENLFVNKYGYDIDNLKEKYFVAKENTEEKVDEETKVDTNTGIFTSEETVVKEETKTDSNNATTHPEGDVDKVDSKDASEETVEKSNTTTTIETPSSLATSNATTSSVTQDEEVKNVKPLKIVGIEKPVKSNIESIGSTTMGVSFAAAVLGILPATALSFNFFGLAAYTVYRVIKNAKYKHIDLKSLLKKFDLDVKIETVTNNNAEEKVYYLIDRKTKQKMAIHGDQIYMIDDSGKAVELTEEQKSKIRYDELKNSLIKIGAMPKNENSRFSFEYIKNNIFKKMVTRVKGYFDKRVERLDKKNAADTLEEKQKYANARIKYDKNNDDYVFEFKEEKGRGLR